MKFQLIDSIVELTRGRRIVAVKAVSLAEEYLADHFPTFPVLPGVLMLEAMVEAAAWLVRDAADFRASLILLREVRNVTYKSFMRPGRLLRVEVECRRLARDESDFSGAGFCDQDEVVRGRYGLRHSSLRDRGPAWEVPDRRLTNDLRARFAVLRSSGVSLPAGCPAAVSTRGQESISGG